MPAPKRDNFLADAVGPREFRLTYSDGFRFGLGFVIAALLAAVVVGGLAWAVIVWLPWHA